MSKVAFRAPRINTSSPERLKRDVESTMHDIEQTFDAVQASIPNFYTTVEPIQVTPFQQVLVHQDFWTPETITSLAAVFIWYIDPLPAHMLDNPNIDVNGQWVKLVDIDAVPLP